MIILLVLRLDTTHHVERQRTRQVVTIRMNELKSGKQWIDTAASNYKKKEQKKERATDKKERATDAKDNAK